MQSTAVIVDSIFHEKMFINTSNKGKIRQMRKIFNRNSILLTMAMLILSVSFSISVKAQTDFVRDEYRINKGCTADEWDLSFDGRNAYLFFPSANENKYKEIDRAITSERRMAFTFAPKSVRVEQGKMIEFITSGAIVQGSPMYAIYYRANNDYQNPINADKYLLPICPDDLPADSGTVNVKLIPASKYYFGNELVAISPTDAVERNPISSNVKKLSAMQLDTTNMEPGFYWFTLQTTATVQITNIMGGTSYPQQFAKTTPPVLIEIFKSIIDNQPTVKIIEIKGEECKQQTITANIEDKDNLPDRNLKQNLTVIWKINGNEVVNKSLGTNSNYTDSITTKDLLPGNYTVEVIVKNGKYEASDNRKFPLYCPSGVGAGIIYFQFDEPYDTRENLYNPNDWLENYGRRNQCQSGSYPREEFSLFYDKTNNLTPQNVESNMAKLDSIALALSNFQEVQLYIAGYADFRANPTYNIALVKRRLAVVKQYLMSKGIDAGRLIPMGEENYADFKAQSCATSSCDITRRWDRRVELIYFINQKPKLPNYNNSTCDPNANLLFEMNYEGSFEDITGD